MLKRVVRSFLLSSRGRALVDFCEEHVPYLRQWQRFEYHQQFSKITRWSRIFEGVYPTFAEATRAIPPTKKAGYDNADSAGVLAPSGPLLPSDYPVLFWLTKLFEDKPRRLFDVGGYVGISFYSYQGYLSYPPGLEWVIYDVPAVTAAGERLVRARNAAGLSFSTNFNDADGADILLAAGSLQFIETPFAQLLAGLKRLPRHILINKTPLQDGEPFVTLQDIGPAVCAYHVFNRKEFVESIEALGYEVVNDWQATELSCYIPFHADKHVQAFSGLYFRLKPGAPALAGR